MSDNDVYTLKQPETEEPPEEETENTEDTQE